MRRTLAVIALAVAPVAFANPLTDVAGGATAFYAQTKATYSVAGTDRDFTMNRIALDYSEQANNWLYVGIRVGLSFLDASSEPLIDSTSLPGYYFGVFGGVRFFERGGFSITGEGRYARDWWHGTVSGDALSVDEGEGVFQLGASYRINKEFNISAGGYSSNSEGHIDRTGTTLPGSADFTDTASTGAYAGIDVVLADGGSLGFRWEGGANETLAFTYSVGF